MKHIYKLTFAVFSITALSLSTYSTKEIAFQKAFKNSHLRFTGGAQPAKTGAPGEANCTQCHSGSVQAGAGINMVTMIDNATQMPVTTYTPGLTYSITITTAAATKRGFQMSARVVDGNTQAGTAVGVAGVSSVQSSGGQQYVNHTGASALSSAGWAFTWTAPATNVGDVTFYLATNITNNNSSDAGDVIRLSEHTFSAATVTVNPPVASFTSNVTTVCDGSSITFTNTSTENPTAVLWSFPGGTPSASIEINPTVVYNTPGNYDVTLTATNSGGTDDQISTGIITVNDCASLNEKSADVVVVYPNPTNDNVTVKNINLANFKQIELVDFNGKTLQKWTISSKDMNLTLKNIQAGSYFLKLKGNKELKKAIIIQ